MKYVISAAVLVMCFTAAALADVNISIERPNGFRKTVTRDCAGLRVHVERPLLCSGRVKTVDIQRGCAGFSKTVTVK